MAATGALRSDSIILWFVLIRGASIVNRTQGVRSRQTGVSMQTVSQLLRGKGSQIFSVAPTDSVLRAIEIMATRHVGALLVMDQGSLAGIISERDYARKVILMNRSSHDTPVSDIMTSPAVPVAPTDNVHHCMEDMTQRRFL